MSILISLSKIGLPFALVTRIEKSPTFELPSSSVRSFSTSCGIAVLESTSPQWLRDASFLKLKNAEIGYTYKKMRFYISGSNLLTFSKFKLWDPEQGGGSGLKYPTQRVFNIGIQMTL